MSTFDDPPILPGVPPAGKPRHPVLRFVITGLIALLPLLVTVYILSWAFTPVHNGPGRWIGTILARLLQRPEMGAALWALGDVIALVILTAGLLAIGALLGTFIGRKLFHLMEDRMGQVPVVRVIYPLVRQVTELFTDKGKHQFGQVVAVQYPTKGIYSIGFLTSKGIHELRTPDGRKRVCVFVPTAPSPLTGWIAFFPADDVVYLSMSVDEAFKLIVSAGVVIPPQPTEVPEQALPPSAVSKGASGG